MRYRPILMSAEGDGPWFNSEAEAQEWIDNRGCRLNATVGECESCAVEWVVFSDTEISEIERRNVEDEYDPNS